MQNSFPFHNYLDLSIYLRKGTKNKLPYNDIFPPYNTLCSHIKIDKIHGNKNDMKKKKKKILFAAKTFPNIPNRIRALVIMYRIPGWLSLMYITWSHHNNRLNFLSRAIMEVSFLSFFLLHMSLLRCCFFGFCIVGPPAYFESGLTFYWLFILKTSYFIQNSISYIYLIYLKIHIVNMSSIKMIAFQCNVNSPNFDLWLDYSNYRL